MFFRECAKCGEPVNGVFCKDGGSFDIYCPDCFRQEDDPSLLISFEEYAEVTPEMYATLRDNLKNSRAVFSGIQTDKRSSWVNAWKK